MATTVGPESTATYTDLMLEMKLALQRAYRTGGVLMDQLKKGNLANFEYDGNTARIPIIRNLKQGTGPVSETGTLIVGRKARTMKANVGIAALEHTVSLTKRLPKVTNNSVVSWAQAAELEMDLAKEAIIKTTNELLNGPGTGLLATVSGATSGSAATTQQIKVANANMALLYVGRVVDVLVRSSLATTKLGAIIVSVDETAGSETITVADCTDDTATFSFATATTDGVYIENSNVGPSNILQGIGAATAQTGTFQGIDRAVFTDWKAVDARNGVTTTADLGIAIMDAAIRRRGRNGVPTNHLWIADPAVLDKFSQTLLTQSRWQGDKGTLDTGFEYMTYRGERLFADYDAQPGRITNVPLDDAMFLEIGNGPEFDNVDGSIFKRFTRSLPYEAWLVDERQFVAKRVNRFVYADNLTLAT